MNEENADTLTNIRTTATNRINDMSEVRKSSRERKTTQKAKESMEQELEEKLQKVIQESQQACIKIDENFDQYDETDLETQMQILQELSEKVKTCYGQIRAEMGSDGAASARVSSDRTLSKIEAMNNKLTNNLANNEVMTKIAETYQLHPRSVSPQRSHRSRTSQTSQSSISSRRAILAAQAAGLQVEREATMASAREEDEIMELEAEELTRQAQQELEERTRQAQQEATRAQQELEERARQAQQQATRAQQEADEKIRRIQSKTELEARKRRLNDHRLAAEIQRTQIELQVLETMSVEGSHHSQESDDRDEKEEYSARRIPDENLQKPHARSVPSQKSHRSRTSRTSPSSTSSKRAMLAAQSAAPQVEREAKMAAAQEEADIHRIEAELARQAVHEAKMIVERAQQDRQESEEKIRRVQAKSKLDERKGVLANQRSAAELQRTQAELQMLEKTSVEGSQHSQDYDNCEVKEKDSPRQQNNSAPPTDAMDIIKTLAESLNLSRLPAPEPSVFNGDVLKYPAWKASFATLIDSKKIPTIERLHYLKKYLAGEAKDVVEGNFFFETEDAYDTAKEMLDDRYGNTFVISEAFRDKLHDWPRVPPRDGHALRTFSDFLRQCQVAMKHLPSLDILNDCRENRKLLQKLPDWLVQRWSRIATDTEQYPSFQTFVKFVSEEADIACNPITSLYQTDNKYKKRPMANTLASSTNVQASDVSKYEGHSQCELCLKKNHSLHNCAHFKEKQPIERSEFIRKKGLCFGCLTRGHLSKDCPQKCICETCEKKHPTCLHGDYEAIHN